MKKIDVEIWKCFLDASDGIVYAETLCRDLGMTRRQLLSRVAGLNQSIVKRAGDSKDVYFMVSPNMDEKIDATINILAAFFKCDRMRVESVVNSTSIAGYMTLDEISVLTHVPSREVAYILYVMPNIVMQKGSKKNHYTRRFEHVPINLGTPDRSAQLAQ